MLADRIAEEDLLGPDAMRSDEMEALWQWIRVQDAGLPNPLTLAPAEARRIFDETTVRWNAALPEVAGVERIDIPATPGVAAEMIEPQFAEPGCILFLHGGGWAFGNLLSHARFARLLAETTGSRVLAVDYRLAPEHPYPAALDDSRAAWRWLTAQAEDDPDLRGPLVVAGDSAGANLAVALALDTAASGSRVPNMILSFYGAFKAGTDSASYRRFAEGFGLTSAMMGRFWDWYVPPDAPDRRRDPLVSPLDATDEALRGLPPVFLNAAGLDPLLSDTLAFRDRLAAAGVAHELAVTPGVHHGFMQMSLRLGAAREAFAQAATFYRSQATRQDNAR